MSDTRLFNHGYLNGARGVKLYHKNAGNPDAPAVVFIHGWSQTHAVWIRQFNSELADEYQLISFDLRGHGYSECPAGAEYYMDGRLQADDVQAIINHYGKRQVALVGWSSGALVIGDYLRRHGPASVAGIVLVCGLHGLGIANLDDLLGTGPAQYMPDTMVDDLETQYRAMQRCSRDMVVDITPAQLQILTAQAMMTPPAVRAAMMNRVIDNTDVLTSFTE
ncbi:MAG: alpha/beta hydrolase, partial [Gammaproteobacteria bacterium]|nr:alpha/beta hydrolase [Gammaproteobacteria bacterium]